MEYSHNISHFGTEAWNLNATSKFSVNASEPTPLGRGYVSWFSLATLGVAIISVLVWNLKSATVLRILVGRIKEALENVWMLSRWRSSGSSSSSSSICTRTVPTSVNYHFTRRCNYACGFCFHTAKTSFVLPLDEAKRGLAMLAQAGMEKVNFSGGEPFLHGRGRYLGDLVRYCKEELRLPSVSVVSNGSLVTQRWFQQYGSYLDILAVSCDSFNSDTNAAIGRQQGGKDHVMSLMRVREWCTQYKVAFKLNTVVNTYNKDEDMTEEVMQLNPCRWKVFQCLVIPGENAGEDALRNAEKFVISDEEFQQYLERHKDVSCLVPESNDAMRYSYLILDEYMRFLDGGTKKPSPSLLDVGVQNAIDGANFDEKMFFKRGGKYTWTKADMRLEW